MKRFLRLFILLTAAIALSLAPGVGRAQDDPNASPPNTDPNADQGASFQTFYDQLGDQGTGSWMQTDDYGYVFQPNVSDPNWAPYTQGSWVYTDDGWTWASTEPWGWATYHYGRWANINGAGWVWVPGNRWAPAWVSWRYGDGYVGWAPLPPDANYDDQDSDYHFGDDVDVTFDIGPGCYNFVPIADIGAPNCGLFVINRYRNWGIINRTRNITNINVNHGGRGFQGVAVNGPPLQEVNAQASHPVPTARLSSARDPGRSSLQGTTLSVFAPSVNTATAHQGRPTTVSRTISHPTFNQGTSISHPLAVNSRVHSTAPTAAQIQQARQAQANVPSEAKISMGHNPQRTSSPPTSQQASHFESANTGEPPHTQSAPPATFHPGNANTGESQRHTQSAPPQNFHSENVPQQHFQPAPQEQFHSQVQHNQPPPQSHPQGNPQNVQHHAPPPPPSQNPNGQKQPGT